MGKSRRLIAGRGPIWLMTSAAARLPSFAASAAAMGETIEHAGGVLIARAGGVDHLRGEPARSMSRSLRRSASLFPNG